MERTALENWLHPNRRALGFACVPPLGIAAIGFCLALWPIDVRMSAWNWLGIVIVVLALATIASLVRLTMRSPIAYRDGHVLFNLRSGPPIAVPVDIVEAFFVGQGPANLPGDLKGQERTINLIARLSQRATEWAARDVKPAFGTWADGYVTVRGTWCEPLNSDVVRRINRRLHEVKSEAKNPSADVAAR